MGKIIYNTNNELTFRLQGTMGEDFYPQMKDYAFNFSSGGHPDIIVGYAAFVLKFALDISENDYLDFLAFSSWLAQGESFAVQFDTGKTVNTTLDGDAGKNESDPKLIPLTATTGLAIGDKCFMRSADGLRFEGVDVNVISSGVSVTAKDDLKYNYNAGDIFRHYRYIPTCLALSLEKFNAKRTGALNLMEQGYRRYTLTCKEEIS